MKTCVALLLLGAASAIVIEPKSPARNLRTQTAERAALMTEAEGWNLVHEESFREKLGKEIYQDGDCVGKKQSFKVEPQPLASDAPVAKIIYISMKEEDARSKEMKKNLDKVASNIPVKRFQAITRHTIGKLNLTDYSTGKDESYLKIAHSDNPTVIENTRAIYMSHSLAIMEAENLQGDKPLMIMEDDARLNADWKQKVQSIVDSAPEDWDMIKLVWARWSRGRCADQVNTKLYRATPPTYENVKGKKFFYYQGNGAYLVRPSRVNKINAAMRAHPLGDVDGSFIKASCAEKNNVILGRPCINVYNTVEVFSVGYVHEMASERFGATLKHAIKEKAEDKK